MTVYFIQTIGFLMLGIAIVLLCCNKLLASRAVATTAMLIFVCTMAAQIFKIVWSAP